MGPSPENIVNIFFVTRYTERVNIEAHLFSLQTKRKGNNQQPYVPPEGRLVMDINRAWQIMESAEHDREMALRQELIRWGRCGSGFWRHV